MRPISNMTVGTLTGTAYKMMSMILRKTSWGVCLKVAALAKYGMWMRSCTTSAKAYRWKTSCSTCSQTSAQCDHAQRHVSAHEHHLYIEKRRLSWVCENPDHAVCGNKHAICQNQATKNENKHAVCQNQATKNENKHAICQNQATKNVKCMSNLMHAAQNNSSLVIAANTLYDVGMTA